MDEPWDDLPTWNAPSGGAATLEAGDPWDDLPSIPMPQQSVMPQAPQRQPDPFTMQQGLAAGMSRGEIQGRVAQPSSLRSQYEAQFGKITEETEELGRQRRSDLDTAQHNRLVIGDAAQLAELAMKELEGQHGSDGPPAGSSQRIEWDRAQRVLDRAKAKLPDGFTDEEEGLAGDLDYFTRWQPKDIGALKSKIDTLSRPAQKRLAGFDAQRRLEGQPAYARNYMTVSHGVGADVTSGPMRLANAVLPDAINPLDKAAPDYVNWLAEESDRIASEKDKENAVVSPWVARGLRGAGRALPVTGLAGKDPYSMIATSAAVRGNQAITEGEDAGLKGGQLYAYAGAQAAIEGGVSAAFQRLGMGGLENTLGRGVVSQGIKQALKKAGKNYLEEIPEEVLISLGDRLVSRLGTDPQAWTPDGVQETILETVGQTTITMGLAEAPNIAEGAAKSVLRKTMPPPAAKPGTKQPWREPGDVDTSILDDQPSEAKPAAPSEATAKPAPVADLEAEASRLRQEIANTNDNSGELTSKLVKTEAEIKKQGGNVAPKIDLIGAPPTKTIGKKVQPVEQPSVPPSPAAVDPVQQEAVPEQSTGDIKATPTEQAEIEPPVAQPVKRNVPAAMEKILQKLPELDEAGARSYLSTIDKMLSREDLPVSEQEMVSEVRKHVVERWKAAKQAPPAQAPKQVGKPAPFKAGDIMLAPWAAGHEHAYDYPAPDGIVRVEEVLPDGKLRVTYGGGRDGVTDPSTLKPLPEKVKIPPIFQQSVATTEAAAPAAPPVAEAPAKPKKVGLPPPGPAPTEDLNREDEWALAQKAQSGDQASRDKFVQHYLPLVKKIAGKYRASNEGMDELTAEGNAALVVAMDKFDPTKFEEPTRFSTYAYKVIDNAILTHLNKSNKAPGQLAEDAPDKVDPGQAPPDEQAVTQESMARAEAAVLQLPLKQRVVMDGKKRGLNLEQIAEEQGVTKQRIQQLEKDAKARIKGMMEGKPPRPAKPSDNEPFKPKSALNKKKGAVVISVGQEADEKFLNDISKIGKKADTMDVPALQRQLAIAEEQAANPEATPRQKQILVNLVAILQKKVPPPVPVQPAKPKENPLELMQDAVFQFEQILGTPLQAVPDAQLNADDKDAGEYAKEFGLTPVFVTSKSGQQLPIGGISHGKIIVLRAGMPEESLWELVSHEVTHGTGLDAKNNFDRKLIADKAAEYRANVSKSRQEDIDNDPAMRAREGAAMLVGEFGRSPSLRKQIREGSPSFYTQIRDKILDAVGIKIPKYQAFRETIEHFRQEREKNKKQDTNPESDPLKEAKPVKTGSLKDLVGRRVGDKKPSAKPSGEAGYAPAAAAVKGPQQTVNTNYRSNKDDQPGISAADVMLTWERIFNVPIRTGGFSKRAAGIYQWMTGKDTDPASPNVVRLRESESANIALAAHEIAHSIDEEFEVVDSMPVPIKNEIRGLDYDRNKARDFEGWAEFLRHYITEGDTDAIAPNVHEWFQQVWLGAYPDMAAKINKARDQAKAFADQSLFRKTTAMIRDSGPKDLEHERARQREKMLDDLQVKFINKALWLQKLDEEAAKQEGYDPSERLSAEAAYWYYSMQANANAEYAVEHGVFDLRNSEHIGDALTDIKKLIKPGEYEDAVNYMWARHTVYMQGKKEGYNTGLDPDHAQAIMDAMEPEQKDRFEEAAEKLAQYNNDLLNMLVKSGAMNEVDYEREIKYYQDEDGKNYYMPLNRARDQNSFGSSSKYIDLPKPVRGRSSAGSGKPIMDPFDSTIGRTQMFYARAAKERVLAAIKGLADPKFGGVGGLGKFLTRIDPRKEAIAFKLEEVIDELVKADLVDEDTARGAKIAARLLAGRSISDENFNFFTGRHKITDADTKSKQWLDAARKEADISGIVKLWRPLIKGDAQKGWWLTQDKEGNTIIYESPKEFYDMLAGQDEISLGVAGRVISSAMGVFRAGATTLNPKFVAKNMARDYQEYQGRSEHADTALQRMGGPLTMMGKVIAAEVSKLSKAAEKTRVGKAIGMRGFDYNDAVLDLADRLGGNLYSQLGYDIGSRQIFREDKIGAKSTSALSILGKTVHTAKRIGRAARTGVNVVQEVISKSDLPPRLAELELAAAKLGYTAQRNSAGQSVWYKDGNEVTHLPEHVQIKLMSAFAEATTNFKRTGTVVQKVNPYSRFLNATIQSQVREFRSAKSVKSFVAGKATQVGTRAAAAYLTYLGAMAGLGALHWLLRHDDDDWRNKKQYERDAYWSAGYNGTTYFQVPKSRDAGSLVANLMERMLDSMFHAGDTDGLAEVFGTHAWNRLPEVGSGPPKAALDVYSDWDGFRDRPLTPERLKDEPTELKATAYTLETSKSLAKAFSAIPGIELSPIQTEHLLSQSTGGMYQRIGDFWESAASGRLGLRHVPGLNGVLLNRHQDRSLDDFYREWRAMPKKVKLEAAQGKVNPESIARKRKLDDYGDLITKIGVADRDEQGRKIGDFDPYLVGLSRDALDQEPLESNPSPYKEFSKAPKKVQEIVLEHLSNKADEVLRSFPEDLTPVEERKAAKEKVSLADALKAKQQDWAADRKFAIKLIKDSGVPLQEVVDAIREKTMAEVDEVGKKAKTIGLRRQARDRATKLREKSISEFVDAITSGGAG